MRPKPTPYALLVFVFIESARPIELLAAFVNPFVQDPFAAHQHWTTGMSRFHISSPVFLIVEPKYRVVFARKQCEV